MPAAALKQDRFAHQAVTLKDGRILLLGGWSDSLHGTTAGSEIYQPASGAFVPTTDRNGQPVSMTVSRLDVAALSLPAVNRVLVVGGQEHDAASGGKAISVDTAELYSEE